MYPDDTRSAGQSVHRIICTEHDNPRYNAILPEYKTSRTHSVQLSNVVMKNM